MKQFVVIGKITGKQRPRVNRYTGSIYTPQKTKEYEELIKECYIGQCGHEEPTDKPVKITIYAYFTIPKMVGKRRRQELLGTEALKKPDADNIAKIVLDALNGLAYKDDKQVYFLECYKYYGETEELNIMLED